MRKPNSNAVLKTLPSDTQAALAAFASSHSLEESVAYALETYHLTTSRSAMSEFLSWFRLAQRFAAAENMSESVLERMAARGVTIDPDLSAQIGQELFEAEAIAAEDPKAWVELRRAAIQTEQLKLDRLKFMRETAALFLDKLQDARAQAIAGSDDTREDKLEALGPVLFGDTWSKLKALA